MQINGVEYCITLYFDDSNGERVSEKNFSDFSEVNKFIRSNTDNPLYTKYQVSYTFREMIDGEPGLPSWEDAFDFCEVSEEKAQRLMDEYVTWMQENRVYWDKKDEESRQFHYREIFCDYNAKKSRLHEISYACPKCMRELEHCRCRYYPEYLVQIDKLMLPIIRELNMNGYVTKYCCAGHPATDEIMNIYIVFDNISWYSFRESKKER